MTENQYDLETGELLAPADECPDFHVERRRFARVRAGRVLLSQGKGNAPVELPHLRGRLLGVAQRWDPGKPEKNIKPHWRVAAKLATPELGEVFFETDTNSTTPYVGMVGALLKVERGTFVALTAVLADEEAENAPTFLNVHVWDPAARTWSQVMREGWPASITDKALHYQVKAENARALVPTLPAFVDAIALGYELPPRNGQPQTATPAPASVTPPTPSPAVQTSAAPVPAPNPQAPTTKVPEGKSAFGFVPGRWPSASDFDLPVTEAQATAIGNKLLARGFDEDERRKVHDAIVRAFGLAVTAEGSKGSAMLVYDLLANASNETIDALTVSLEPAAAPDEYDPFAE